MPPETAGMWKPGPAIILRNGIPSVRAVDFSASPPRLRTKGRVWKATLAAGVQYNHQLRHIQVRVYGNTALSTSYVVGSSTSPDGTTSRVNMRRTTVLIKEDGQWKEVHTPPSPRYVSLSRMRNAVG